MLNLFFTPLQPNIKQYETYRASPIGLHKTVICFLLKLEISLCLFSPNLKGCIKEINLLEKRLSRHRLSFLISRARERFYLANIFLVQFIIPFLLRYQSKNLFPKLGNETFPNFLPIAFLQSFFHTRTFCVAGRNHGYQKTMLDFAKVRSSVTYCTVECA